MAITKKRAITSLHNANIIGTQVTLVKPNGSLMYGTVVFSKYEMYKMDIAIIELNENFWFDVFIPLAFENVDLCQRVHIWGWKENDTCEFNDNYYYSNASVNMVTNNSQNNNNTLFKLIHRGFKEISGTSIITTLFNGMYYTVGVQTDARDVFEHSTNTIKHTTYTYDCENEIMNPQNTNETKDDSMYEDLMNLSETSVWDSPNSYICEAIRVPDLIEFMNTNIKTNTDENN